MVVTDIRMPPTNTNDGLLAAQRIRAEHPGTGVLVLSQYVETRQAIKLLQHAPQRVGYLLKDRVSDIAEFAETLRRIARGGSAIDPDVVAQLLRRSGEDSALAGLTGREQRHPRPHRRGPLQPCHLPAAVPVAQDGRHPRRVHLRQARPAARGRRPPARPRGAHVHPERMKGRPRPSCDRITPSTDLASLRHRRGSRRRRACRRRAGSRRRSCRVPRRCGLQVRAGRSHRPGPLRRCRHPALRPKGSRCSATA